jgi:hypothetical protein
VTLTRNKIEVGTYKASLWPTESVVRMGTVTTPIKSMTEVMALALLWMSLAPQTLDPLLNQLKHVKACQDYINLQVTTLQYM